MRACLAIALALAAAPAAQQVTKESVPGVTNFARLDGREYERCGSGQ